MWPYYILIFIIFLLQFRFGKYLTYQKRFYVGITLIFLFAALRGNGAVDYFRYLQLSKGIVKLSDIIDNNTYMEIGFSIISYIVNFFKLNSQFVIAIMNFISIISICIFIKKLSFNWNLSLLIFLIYLFNFDMQSSRNAIAISVAALASTYLLQKKYSVFMILLFFAFLFHQSVLIVLLFIPLLFLNIDLYTGLGFFLCGSIFTKWIGLDQFMLFVLQKLGLGYFYAKYLRYSMGSDFGYPFRLYDPRLWILIIMFILAKIYLKKPSREEKFAINCVFMSGFLMILFSEHTILAFRMSAFFSIYTLILFPMLLNRWEIMSRNIKSAKTLRVLGILFYFIWTVFYVAYTKPAEYRFFF